MPGWRTAAASAHLRLRAERNAFAAGLPRSLRVRMADPGPLRSVIDASAENGASLKDFTVLSTAVDPYRILPPDILRQLGCERFPPPPIRLVA